MLCISPIQRPHYIANSYTYLFLKKVILVPHCSIALHLSSLEWGFFYLNQNCSIIHGNKYRQNCTQ